MVWVRQYSAPNVVVARKLKALNFYMINPLLYEKWPLCVSEPLFRRLRGNVPVHLRLIGKPVVYLNFFSLGAMVQTLRANIDCIWKSPFLKGAGHFGPKFQAERHVPH